MKIFNHFTGKIFTKYFLGVLGIKVKIMLPHDPKGVTGPRIPLPDLINIKEPRDEPNPIQPYSEHRQERELLPPPSAY